MKTKSLMSLLRLAAVCLLASTAGMIAGSCDLFCKKFEFCGEYFYHDEPGSNSVCTELYGIKACNGERSCLDLISEAAQSVDSCADLDEDWVGTCEWTGTELCASEITYTAYPVDCDALCRAHFPEQAQFACEGAAGVWTAF